MKKLFLVLCAIAGFTVIPGHASRGFNGSSDVITVSSPTSVISGPETVSLWIYPTTVDGNIRVAAAILNGTSSGSDFTIGLGAAPFSPTNSFAYIWGCCGASGPSYTSCGTAVINNWYSVVVWIDTAGKYTGSPASGITVSGASGVICSVQISASGASRSCCAPLTFGVQDTIHPFAGYVAQVGRWNDILSPQERAGLATWCPQSVSHPTRSTALIEAYPLLGISGASTEPDTSGHQQNGALTGTTAISVNPPCSMQ